MSDEKKSKPLLTELDRAKLRAQKAQEQLRDAEKRAAQLADKDRKRLAALVGEKLLAGAAVNAEFKNSLDALVKRTFADDERRFLASVLNETEKKPAPAAQ